jgi:hypothetical protein
MEDFNMTRLFCVMALLGVACDGATTKDTGDSGTTPAGAVVTSCDWGIGLCYEFEDYAGSEQWCSDIGDEYGFTTVHSAGGCASGEVYVCELDGVSLADDTPTTAYYYSDWTGAEAPADACATAGGTGA